MELGFATVESMDLIKTYKNKKIFVTGHTGFKGSWLVQWLSLLGADIHGYALASQHDYDHYQLIGGDRICQSEIADIRDIRTLECALRSFDPDFIFHLAARALVIDCYDNPLEAYGVNAMGTANLLDIVSRMSSRVSVVIVTTDKVYANDNSGHAFNEDDFLGGKDPYSTSKVCAELIARTYKELHASESKGIAVARAGNVIGGGDWAANRLIPDMAKTLHNGEKLTIRHPGATRPWQHVLEPVYAYLLLGSCLSDSPQEFSDCFNFGPEPEDAIPVEEMVKKYISYLGHGSYQVAVNEKYEEASKLILDTSKARKKLGWRPIMNVDTALEKTVKWYKTYYSDPQNTRRLTIEQIRAFQNVLQNED